jgi:membrane-bound serine protease (ClpP class)
MNPLMDPNVGYTLLVGGLVLAVLALFMPGTGLIEIGALFALVLAGVTMVNLPVNGWALAVMAAAAVPLALAVRNKRSAPPLIAAGILLLAGSLFVFRGENGGAAVHPLVAVVVSIGAIVLVWFLARKSVQAIGLRKSHDLEKLVGMDGTARTDLRPEGSVYVGGETWTARCSDFIPAGSAVRVIRREGLVLEVEKTAEEQQETTSV